MLVLVVLVLPLLAPGAAPCLRCWPDAAPYVPYDLRLLLGAAQPGEATGLEKQLSALVLGGGRDPGVGVMERERLEREAGKLFYHLDQIITRNRHDPGRLMKEAQREQQNFTRRLRAASAAVLEQVCSASCGRPQPFDLAECSNCRRLQAQCRDPRVCSGASVILAVGLSLGALLGAGATVGRRMGSKEVKEGLAAGGPEPPTDQEDGPPTDQGDGAPTDQEDEPPMDPGDRPPADQGDGAPMDQDWPPADHGDGAPMDQDWPPADHGDGAPTDQDGPPADQGDGAPTDQDGPPADQGDGAPMDQKDRFPVEQGDGGPTEGQPPAPRA